MLKKIGWMAAGLGLAFALVGCGNDVDSGGSGGGEEKGGYTKTEFVNDFKDGFGTDQGIEANKVECIGGEVFDALPAATLEELDQADFSDDSEMPDEAKTAFASSFADCLDVKDLLAASGAEDSGMDVDCLSSSVEVSNEDEVEFWTQTLNGETPSGGFMNAITEAATKCAMEG